jgi:hypothetical protein
VHGFIPNSRRVMKNKEPWLGDLGKFSVKGVSSRFWQHFDKCGFEVQSFGNQGGLNRGG